MSNQCDGAAAGPELFLDLSATGGSLPKRLAAAIDDAVRSGRLAPGTRLPSSRSLAVDLGLSRGVVVQAYARLGDNGVLVARSGSGTTVALTASSVPGPTAPPVPPPVHEPPFIDLRPGPPDLSAFPRAAWSAALRDVLRTLPDRELGYVTPWGTETLRTALAAYLSRARGARAGPGSVVVVSGVTQGLTILAKVLRSSGHRGLAVEAPSNAVQRDVLGSHGMRIVDVPVDEQGIDVQALADTACRAVLVTPAHQFPSGTQLSSARRAALLRWADDVDGVVIEDDYDAEFRYERVPLPCLQASSPGRVALVGSVSKTLAPGVRLGWIVPPERMRHDVAAAKRNDDFGSSVLEQHTLAHLLRSGGYDRHVRALRRRYRARRDALTGDLRRELPAWRITGVAAGLHVLLELPADVPEQALVRAAAGKGLALQGTAAMYGVLPPAPALVLSFARGPATFLHEGVRRLAEAAAAARDAPPEPADDRPVPAPAVAADYFSTVNEGS